MRRIMGVSLLSLVLACSAYAGDMPFGVTGEMPNGSNSTYAGEIQNGATGVMPNGVTGEIPYGATDPVTEIVLTLLNGILSIF